MGLCKCPKKKVTNLFCFEHRVNVCEHCLVDSHQNCVVQSYLQWLTDSDYDTNCTLCERSLNDAETVRLQCLHLLHWECLDTWARRLPATTAPAGYRCPFCREALFPSANQVSPVIDQLRLHLQKANWARAGLGLPVLPELNNVLPPSVHLVSNPAQQQNNRAIPQQTPVEENTVSQKHTVYEAAPPLSHPNHSYRSATPATHLEMDNVSYAPDQVSFTARKKGYGEREEDTKPLLDRDADSDANKYKRRPAMQWFRQLWRAKYGSNPPVEKLSSWKRGLLIALLAIFALITVVTMLSRMGLSAENDPQWDPMANPNIHVAMQEESINNHI